MDILALASLELNRTDNKQVVKVAGIVRRLRNWYRKLVDQEYRAKVLKLQTDSIRVKHDIDELEKYISEVNQSIKDSDVESYNFAVDRVRNIANRLAKELSRYEQAAKEADPDVKNEFTHTPPTITTSPTAPTSPVSIHTVPPTPTPVQPPAAPESQLHPSLERIERVHISNKVRDAVWNIRALKETLARHNLPQTAVDELIDNPDRLNDFYNTLAKEIKAGQIVDVWQSPQSQLDINRHGEMQYRIVTNPFIIPGTNFYIQVTVEGTDLSARQNSPRSVFSVHKFNFIDARQKSSSRLKQLGKVTGKTPKMIRLQSELNERLAKLSHKIETGE